MCSTLRKPSEVKSEKVKDGANDQWVTRYRIIRSLSKGQCSSNSPFLKSHGAEASKGPRRITFKELRVTMTLTRLKSTL